MHNVYLGKGIILVIIVFLIMSSLSIGGELTKEIRLYSYQKQIDNFEECSSIFESFEDGFGPWEADADMPWDPEIDMSLSWFVTRTQEYAYDGEWSLNFTANGLFDDGTVWIFREVSLPPGTWDIGLEFYFWSMASDVNNWQVIAYIGEIQPEIEG